MKLNSLYYTLILIALTLSSQAYSSNTPTKSPRCQGQSKIRSVKQGAGVVFNEDCTTAYVLPPAKGEIELSQPTKPPAAHLCYSLNVAAEDIRTIRDELSRNLKRISRLKKGGSGLGRRGGLGSGREPSEQAKKEIADLERQNIELRKQIEHFVGEQQRLTADMLDKDGSHIAVNYSWNYHDLIDRYQSRNRNVRFERLPIANATLSFHRTLTADTAQYPTLLFLDIAGVSDLNFVPADYTPAGGRVDAQFVANTSQHHNIFGESVGGKIILSLPASCALYDHSRDRMKPRVSARELRGLFSATVSYEYYLQAFRSYTAEFHLSNFIRQVQKQTTKNGFLSSKTINSLIRETNSKDWFKLTLLSDHHELSFDDIRQEVKADLIDRVLSQVAYAQTGEPTKAPDILQPPTSGANQIAGNLGAQCSHKYCKAAGVFLKSISSAFGGNSAVSNFIRSNDFWAEDTVDERKMFRYSGTSSFEIN